MKIIISEQQFRQIIYELDNEDRINQLLDKITIDGMDSLSSDERLELRQLSGEKIPSAELKQTVKLTPPVNKNDDPIESFAIEFYKHFPKHITLTVDQDWWECEKFDTKPGMSGYNFPGDCAIQIENPYKEYVISLLIKRDNDFYGGQTYFMFKAVNEITSIIHMVEKYEISNINHIRKQFDDSPKKFIQNFIQNTMTKAIKDIDDKLKNH